MALILLLSLAAQSPSRDARETFADLGLMRGVEEFVIAACPGRRPPPPYGDLIDRLGDANWRVREAATDRLRAASAGDQRWLFWGGTHPDPEVRLRSNSVVRRLNPCPTCRGSGRSKNWELWPCWDCQGTMTVWSMAMWD